MTVAEGNSMVPTLLVGVGGTGIQVLSRVRRIVESSYGSLPKLPILGFLAIDTDPSESFPDLEALGSPFNSTERFWAGLPLPDLVPNGQAGLPDLPSAARMAPWLPREIAQSPLPPETGTQQIRAYGRLALFYHYASLRLQFNEGVARVQGHEALMLREHGVQVHRHGLNVVIVSSLCGGTGSGMVVDLGYCIRDWLKGHSGDVAVSAILSIPTEVSAHGASSPDGAGEITVDPPLSDRHLANAYATLMEINHFSHSSTEYQAKFPRQWRDPAAELPHSGAVNLVDELHSQAPPFDLTYFVGTNFVGANFAGSDSSKSSHHLSFGQRQELIAQKIYLDLTANLATQDPEIQVQTPSGLPEPHFCSFGLATIAVPLLPVRSVLTSRLQVDLLDWWIQRSGTLPIDIDRIVQREFLPRLHLSETALLGELSLVNDQSFLAEIARWAKQIRQDIAADHRLQCTHQGVNLLGEETGRIIGFPDYLQFSVDGYFQAHLQVSDKDGRAIGDFLQKMDEHRHRCIQQSREALETELAEILQDPQRGIRFADAFIVVLFQSLSELSEKLSQDAETVWLPNAVKRRNQYEAALQTIAQTIPAFSLNKQVQMQGLAEAALSGIEGYFIAFGQHRARLVALAVVQHLKDHLGYLEQQIAKFHQILRQLRAQFQQQLDRHTLGLDTLRNNGLRLYNPEELNLLYRNLLECFAPVASSGTPSGLRSSQSLGLEELGNSLIGDILRGIGPLWPSAQPGRGITARAELGQFLDRPDNRLQTKVVEYTDWVFRHPPQPSRLHRESVAAARLLKLFLKEAPALQRLLRMVLQKSQPLLPLVNQPRDATGETVIDETVTDEIIENEIAATTTSADSIGSRQYHPKITTKIAIAGGANSTDPAVQQLLPFFKECLQPTDALLALPMTEQHQIVFLQELRGITFTEIAGIQKLQQAYHDCKTQGIVAKRARLQGEYQDLPIPIHSRHTSPFAEILPDSPKIFSLLVRARALGVLRLEEHPQSHDRTIYFTRETVIGADRVELGSSWEEALQVLGLGICRLDRDTIESQVKAKLEVAESPDAKTLLYVQVMDYLKQRELEIRGGIQTPEYRREAAVIEALIKTYALDRGDRPRVGLIAESGTKAGQPSSREAPLTQIFCTKCGAKNPAQSNFCFRCGNSLLKPI